MFNLKLATFSWKAKPFVPKPTPKPYPWVINKLKRRIRKRLDSEDYTPMSYLRKTVNPLWLWEV